MSRKYLYVLAGVVLASIVGESVAEAGNYTVYIYNTRRPQQGWFRAGVYAPNGKTQVYTTKAQCKQAIEARVKDNKRFRTDFEKFAIVYQNARPPEGALRSYVSATVVYVPGQRAVASLEMRDPLDVVLSRDSGESSRNDRVESRRSHFGQFGLAGRPGVVRFAQQDSISQVISAI